jgi:hypothetical protein
MAPTNCDTASELIVKLNKLTSDSISSHIDEALELSRKLTACLEDPVSRAIDLAFKV